MSDNNEIQDNIYDTLSKEDACKVRDFRTNIIQKIEEAMDEYGFLFSKEIITGTIKSAAKHCCDGIHIHKRAKDET